MTVTGKLGVAVRWLECKNKDCPRFDLVYLPPLRRHIWFGSVWRADQKSETCEACGEKGSDL